MFIVTSAMTWLTTLLFSLLFVYCVYGKQPTAINTFHTCKDRKVNVSSIIEEVATTNAIECARLCSRNESCKSTNFLRGENICQLMQEKADCEQLPGDKHADVFTKVSPVRETCPYTTAVNPCKFNQPFNETSCQCLCGQGFSGVNCENPPRDCTDINMATQADIYLPGTNEIRNVPCRAALGMMILRFSGSTAFSSHSLDGWDEFKLGYSVYGANDYWLGNDFLHKITSSEHNYVLGTSVRNAAGILCKSRYYMFVMEKEANNYTVHFASASISPEDDGSFSNNTQLHAVDYNSNDCTSTHGSSWWYNQPCPHPSPITGQYPVNDVLSSISTWGMTLTRM